MYAEDIRGYCAIKTGYKKRQAVRPRPNSGIKRRKTIAKWYQSKDKKPSMSTDNLPMPL
ncbi:hypothetical protein HBH64_029700 [Parastagonospora nodorum]|nr:hypothetical protein HBI02_180480 [Parastagonospora nodorum]KAH4307170.1 hypothetical protein HBI01_049100 [Parastagonospora nodorum]KAH4336782.1 hypothetical protein HBI00_012690 [Parastagonospora nodorum]KAH4382516.1 hypothetical protein HBH94_057230 [Parastagonospora nodorum]KAH4471340.1 hypothetical protein HBH90_049830 [Parastagonospora nodorum]